MEEKLNLKKIKYCKSEPLYPVKCSEMDTHSLLDTLYKKARDGHISEEELSSVMERLEKFTDGDDGHELWMLIQILGDTVTFGQNKIERQIIQSKYFDKCRQLIEKHLYCPQNPGASAQAMEVLCQDWGLTSDYLDVIKFYLKGVEWDTGEDAKLRAIFVAGDYIRETGNKDCLRYLLNIFENEQESVLIRTTAYERIAYGYGKSWEEISKITEEVISNEQLVDIVDKFMIEEARKHIAE